MGSKGWYSTVVMVAWCCKSKEAPKAWAVKWTLKKAMAGSIANSNQFDIGYSVILHWKEGRALLEQRMQIYKCFFLPRRKANELESQEDQTYLFHSSTLSWCWANRYVQYSSSWPAWVSRVSSGQTILNYERLCFTYRTWRYNFRKKNSLRLDKH